MMDVSCKYQISVVGINHSKTLCASFKSIRTLASEVSHTLTRRNSVSRILTIIMTHIIYGRYHAGITMREEYEHAVIIFV